MFIYFRQKFVFMKIITLHKPMFMVINFFSHFFKHKQFREKVHIRFVDFNWICALCYAVLLYLYNELFLEKEITENRFELYSLGYIGTIQNTNSPSFNVSLQCQFPS
jgi:hypothetical protein